MAGNLFDQLGGHRIAERLSSSARCRRTCDRVIDAMLNVEVFVSELEWLSELEDDPSDTVSIS